MVGMDVCDHASLAFPGSLPEFQRLFPDDAACVAYLEKSRWSAYGGLRARGYDHHAIAECGDPEIAEEFLPISHLVFSNLKTWLNGIHHGVSAKHLQAYLNEFTFRFNRRFYPFNAFRSLLGIAGDATAPTYAQLYSGEWEHPRCSGCGS